MLAIKKLNWKWGGIPGMGYGRYTVPVQRHVLASDKTDAIFSYCSALMSTMQGG